MIPQRNISLLANRLAGKGKRRIPEAVLELDYCLAWFLIGLSRSSLDENLIFKGGTALKRCYFHDYRFSEDLDFTLARDMSFADILSGLEEVYKQVRQESGIMFAFHAEDRNRHHNSHTFYLGYEGPLPATTRKTVKVDITIKEKLAFPVEKRRVLRGYEEYADIPGGSLISVYSLDEICVEKFLALTDKARNEPRDLYDFWHLVSNNHVDLNMLWPEVNAKLDFRHRTADGLAAAYDRKEARLKKLWDNRLGSQMAELPQFDDVFRIVRRAVKGAGWFG
ncbi:nucleotidyl transferase AbiEii/AbiGii toxin family protein [Desulfonatronovibrio magnus]|uniref:nucleotidyl transferase AbiEii/AbiGii toxin family protein n=1 Tax=Desulfonatronovibrio magnus TaxID=698827 RepID=UPI0005EAE2CB|nr:nucleotidyl transferase AbiEii/AbiGii toxin family protein [Desulfonatronovibrio magnus]